MIRSRAPVTVRYAETDMMGVVYHANYLPWFEIGRTTLLKEIGISYRDLETAGFRLPVLEVSARYLRPARYDDALEVITVLRERPLVRIRLEYEVRRGDELLATGNTVHAFVDLQGDVVRPPSPTSLTNASQSRRPPAAKRGRRAPPRRARAGCR
jgi:acyl-CoA thioester hydrolase